MLVESPLSSGSDWLFDYFRVPHREQESVESFRQLSDPSTIAYLFFRP